MKTSHLCSKCYDSVIVIDDGKALLQGSFLLAKQSPLTRLWQVYSVAVVQEDRANNTYDFRGLVAKDIETLDVMENLANFEKAQRLDGRTERMGFFYPNTKYFRKEAAAHAIIFDSTTETPCYLEDGLVPEKSGQYDPEDIANAALAFNEVAMRDAQTADNHMPLLDKLLKPYSKEDANLSPIFTNMQIEHVYEDFVNAIKTAYRSLGKVNRFGALRREDKYTDKTIKMDKDVKSALQQASGCLSRLVENADDASGVFLKDVLDVFNMYFDILSLQIKVRQQNGNKAKPDAQAFSKRIESIKSKYKISEDIKRQIGRVALDYDSDVPNVLYGIVSDLETQLNTFKRLKREMHHKTVTKGVIPTVIPVRGLGKMTRR